jgi:hypothetical protein
LLEIERLFGRRPIVYTSSGLWNEMGVVEWASDYLLWVAHYTDAKRPTLPLGWNKWMFWQYTEEGSVAGVKGAVDQNQFNGSLDELQALAQGITIDTGVETPKVPDLPGAIVLVNGLRLRSKPTTSFWNVIGKLSTNDLVRVCGVYEDGFDIWLTVLATDNRVGWCAMRYRGRQYMEWTDG